MRTQNVIFSLSLIAEFLFFPILCSSCTSDAKQKSSFIQPLHLYLSNNYNLYHLPDDKDTIILQKDLLSSKKSLDLSYLFNDSIAINGSYPPNEKWSFFKHSNGNKILGIFYGSKYKIITIMGKKNKTWCVIDLYALRHSP